MLNANPESQRPETDDDAVGRIVETGARGALALVAMATAIVVGTWLAFYLLVFLRRAVSP